MALRLHWLPILPSTFSRDEYPRALTFQDKPSSQNPISVSSSFSIFSNSSSSISSNSFSTSRKCRNLLVFQVPCSTQEQPNPSATIEETLNTTISEPKTRVFAHNVPWNYTVEDIRNLFEKYGTVVDIELSMYDEFRNRGLAFVTMGSAEEAAAALTNLQSYEVQGRVLRTDYAHIQKKKESLPVYRGTKFTVFVGNLSCNVTAPDLKEFFDSINVVAAEVLLQKAEMNKGFAFVSFGSKVEALAAVSSFNGKILMGRPIRVAFLRKKRKKRVEKQN